MVALKPNEPKAAPAKPAVLLLYLIYSGGERCDAAATLDAGQSGTQPRCGACPARSADLVDQRPADTREAPEGQTSAAAVLLLYLQRRYRRAQPRQLHQVRVPMPRGCRPGELTLRRRNVSITDPLPAAVPLRRPLALVR